VALRNGPLLKSNSFICLRVGDGWCGWLSGRGEKSWLHVEVGRSQRHGSSQAIKTKQFGRFHQHDKLSRRGLASPNGSSGPTWIKFLERCLSICQSRTRLVSVRRGWVVLLLSKHTGAKPLQLLCLPRPRRTGHLWVRWVRPTPLRHNSRKSCVCVALRSQANK
jgi:hypothetical protein